MLGNPHPAGWGGRTRAQLPPSAEQGAEGSNWYHTGLHGGGRGWEGSPQAHKGPREGRVGARKEQDALPSQPAGKEVQRGSPAPTPPIDLSQRLSIAQPVPGAADSPQRSGSIRSQPSPRRKPAGQCRGLQLLLPGQTGGPPFQPGRQMRPGSWTRGGCRHALPGAGRVGSCLLGHRLSQGASAEGGWARQTRGPSLLQPHLSQPTPVWFRGSLSSPRCPETPRASGQEP